MAAFGKLRTTKPNNPEELSRPILCLDKEMVVQNGANFLSSLETTKILLCFHLACPNCSAEALDPNSYLLKLGHEEALTKHTLSHPIRSRGRLILGQAFGRLLSTLQLIP